MPRINASSSQGIVVHGLAELNRDLKAVGKDAQRELKEANVRVAKKEGQRAQAAAYSLGGVSAHVAGGITGSGGNAWAGIRLGTDPAAQGAEFGGQGRPTTMQFRPWRGSGSSAGYAVYPTIRRDSADIEREWTDSMTDLLKKHDLPAT